MEEFVGGLWHKLVTRAAERRYPEAAVELAAMEKTAGVLFRAMGGDAGLRVAAAAEASHGARRRWLQRLAGTGERTAHASLDAETLRLPERVDLFPDKDLNRDLYLWLIALAGATSSKNGPVATPSLVAAGAASAAIQPHAQCAGPIAAEAAPTDFDHRQGDPWLAINQQATLAALARFPGLRPRYQRLVEALIAQRHDVTRLPDDERAAEEAILTALRSPGAAGELPAARKPPQPVPLWLYPVPGSEAAAAADGTPAEPDDDAGPGAPASRNKRYAAERVQSGDGKDGFLMMFRAESLLSWAEYVRVNRPQDDDPDPDAAAKADELDSLAVTRDGKTSASKVRFDLDLPSAAQDDLPLGPGILLPEWDWKRGRMLPDYCRVQPMTARDAAPCGVPPPLQATARRLRQQFSALAPTRRWLKNQSDGPEVDVDAVVRGFADRSAGRPGLAAGGYLAQVRQERDLACLVLADLSLSTDAWISDNARIIDVIRDSLTLFAEALSATGDRFGLYGFSSLRRDQVRFHSIKEFDDRYRGAEADAVRGRIAALKPGYYTRMGTAVRFATKILSEQKSALRLLLILSDGKPNDLDHYEGRYGIEDTRMSLIEARRRGLKPFCVTIDREGANYLPHLFGPGGYTVLRRPEELPARLPLLYAQLTGR